jgi:hypothetical protein
MSRILYTFFIGITLAGALAFTAASKGSTLFKDIEATSSVTEQNEQNTQISIFPNPALTHIQVNNSESLKRLDLYNTIGRRVISFEITAPNELYSIGHLQQGLYFVRIVSKNDEVLATQRLSKISP